MPAVTAMPTVPPKVWMAETGNEQHRRRTLGQRNMARAVPHPVWVLTRMRPRRNLALSNLGSPPIPANRRRHQPSPRPWPMPSCRNRTPAPINHSPWPNKPTSTVSPNLPIPVILEF